MRRFDFRSTWTSSPCRWGAASRCTWTLEGASGTRLHHLRELVPAEPRGRVPECRARQARRAAMDGAAGASRCRCPRDAHGPHPGIRGPPAAVRARLEEDCPPGPPPSRSRSASPSGWRSSTPSRRSTAPRPRSPRNGSAACASNGCASGPSGAGKAATPSRRSAARGRAPRHALTHRLDGQDRLRMRRRLRTAVGPASPP